jgi:MFS family permease
MTAFAISCAGSWAYNVALAVFVYEETHSPAWVGAATIGRFVPSVLFGAYGGVLAERFERVRLMASLDWLSTVWMGLLTVVAVVHGPVLLAIALAGLASVTEIVYEPAVAAITPQTVPMTVLAAANTLRNTVDNIAIVAGPAIGAVLVFLGSPSLAFAANAGSFAFSGVVVSRMAVRSKPVDVTDGGTAGPLRQMLVGVRAIGSSATAAILVVYSLLASFVYGVDTVQFVVLSEQQLGTGASGYGYLLAGLGTGGVAAAALVNRLASLPRLGTLILLGMAVYCLPTLMFLVIDNPTAAFAIESVRGAGTLVVDVLAVTALQRSLPSELQARVFGAYFTGVLLAISLGALLTPPVLAHLGLDTTLWLAGGAIPAVCLLGFPWLRRMDQQNAARLAELEPLVHALGGLGIFAEASRPVLERLASSSVETIVPAGTVLIREGAEADVFYALLDGEMLVRSVGEGTAAEILPSMGKGAYFGEIGLLERMPRTATVTAARDSTVLQISGDDFLAALSDAPAATALLEGARSRLARTHPTRLAS